MMFHLSAKEHEDVRRVSNWSFIAAVFGVANIVLLFRLLWTTWPENLLFDLVALVVEGLQVGALLLVGLAFGRHISSNAAASGLAGLRTLWRVRVLSVPVTGFLTVATALATCDVDYVAPSFGVDVESTTVEQLRSRE